MLLWCPRLRDSYLSHNSVGQNVLGFCFFCFFLHTIIYIHIKLSCVLHVHIYTSAGERQSERKGSDTVQCPPASFVHKKPSEKKNLADLKQTKVSQRIFPPVRTETQAAKSVYNALIGHLWSQRQTQASPLVVLPLQTEVRWVRG